MLAPCGAIRIRVADVVPGCSTHRKLQLNFSFPVTNPIDKKNRKRSAMDRFRLNRCEITRSIDESGEQGCTQVALPEGGDDDDNQFASVFRPLGDFHGGPQSRARGDADEQTFFTRRTS